MAYSNSQTSPKPLYSLGFPDPKELYYICAVGNLSSILNYGILSRKKVVEKGIKFLDPSNSAVQSKRENKSPLNKSPDEDNLHHYVNLYFNAFNRTLSNFYDENPNICVLRIHPKILKKKGCIVSDRNAATNKVHFSNPGEASFDGLSSIFLHVPRSRFFEGDLPEDIRIRANQVKQAEVLVPSKVPSSYIKGIFVPDKAVKAMVTQIFNFPEKVTIHPSLFFDVNKNPYWLNEVDAPELSDTDVDSCSETSENGDQWWLDYAIPNNPPRQGPFNWSWELPLYQDVFMPFPYPNSISMPSFQLRNRYPATYPSVRFHPYAPSSSAYPQSVKQPSFNPCTNFHPCTSNLSAPSRPIRTQWRNERKWIRGINPP